MKLTTEGHLFRSFALLLFFFQSSGQPISTGSHNAPQVATKPANTFITSGNQHIRAMLQAQQAARRTGMPKAKTTGIATERLIGHSNYNNNPLDSFAGPVGRTDTGYLKYTGGRGSQYNFDIMGYDMLTYSNGLGYDFGYDRVINMLYNGITTTTTDQRFNPGILADSVFDFFLQGIDTSSHLFFVPAGSAAYATYDAQSQATSFGQYNIGPFIFPGASLEHFTYDDVGNNNNNTYTMYDTATATFDTYCIAIHIYNEAGKVVEDSVLQPQSGTLQPVLKWLYTYNGNGDLSYAASFQFIASTWQEFERFYFTYNPDHTISSDSSTITGSGSWQPAGTDSFGYTPGQNYYTYLRTNTYSTAPPPSLHRYT